ncbi:MAG: hypothetical protein HYZ42_13005 [Bacteroidetes bacterium]|nr:hypothetical protein [Bacteroidota bacterium]
MKELEDYNWFPPVLRNFQTEFIGFFVATFNIYEVFIKHLQTMPLSEHAMNDLCSGSGEPAISIFEKSKCFDKLILTDKYPSTLNWHDDRIDYEKQGKDVLEMKFEQGNCYTMFNAFHHFEDKDKLKIVQNIQKSGSSAFIVEILEPNFFCLMKVFLTTTVGCLLLTFFIKPFSLKRLLFTYIFPVNILTITYDGMISVLKSRSLKQYQKLFNNTNNPIKIYKLKEGLTNIIVIQIVPKK